MCAVLQCNGWLDWTVSLVSWFSWLGLMPRSHHVGWMVEMGKIPMFKECSCYPDHYRVSCVRVKILFVDNITLCPLTLGFITVNSELGWCEWSTLVWFSGKSVFLRAKSNISELSEKSKFPPVFTTSQKLVIMTPIWHERGMSPLWVTWKYDFGDS